MREWKVSEPTETQRAIETLGATIEEAAGLVARYGSLHAMAMETTPLTLSNGKRLRPAIARAVRAAQALAVAWESERAASVETMSGAEEAYSFLKPRLADLPHEVFGVIFLDQKHGILAYRELFRGTISASSVHPREVVKEVLEENAAAVILVHNHPSGCVSPSPDDLRLTEDLRALLKLIDVRVVDHLILGANGYFSFAREGLLNG